jgi:hypothetical protein
MLVCSSRYGLLDPDDTRGMLARNTDGFSLDASICTSPDATGPDLNPMPLLEAVAGIPDPVPTRSLRLRHALKSRSMIALRPSQTRRGWACYPSLSFLCPFNLDPAVERPPGAFRAVSGKAQRGDVVVLRQRVATQSGAARGVLQGP